MGEIITIGLDLAKTVFQAHGADGSGGVVFRKKLRRDKLLAFFAGRPRAWWRWRPAPAPTTGPARSARWARDRLIPPAYVKPFVKRQKNDMADAEAICEAAQRPTMRFVSRKSARRRAPPWSSAPVIYWSGSAHNASMLCAGTSPNMVMSFAKPCWSTARQSQCFFPAKLMTTSSRCHLSPRRGAR